MSRKYVVTGFILWSVFLVSACGNAPTGIQSDLPYVVSFESAKDTTGWNGIIPEMFVEDAAPYCGNRAMYVGGGCIQPAAWMDFPLQVESGMYRLSCWGKKDVGDGAVVLRSLTNHDEIAILITEPQWTYYESEAVLFCQAPCKLRLEIYIGGIVPEFVYVDCLTVEKINH